MDLANRNGCHIVVTFWRQLAAISSFDRPFDLWSQNTEKMPRGRKRKQEDNSKSGGGETADDKEEELPSKKSPAKKTKEQSHSLTFKIEHW